MFHLPQNRSRELSAAGKGIGGRWGLRQTAQQKTLVKAFAVFYLVLVFLFVLLCVADFSQVKTFFAGVFKLSPQFYEHHSRALQQLQGLYRLH